jgi:tetratricopeptide (TPR) repeat protein
MKALLLLLLVGAALAAPADSLLDRAEYVFFNRHRNPTWMDSAYAMLATLHRAEPRNERCLYLWSRIHVQRGDDAKSKSDKLREFGRARAIAETLIAVNEGNALAHCWWGVAQGRIGQTKGVIPSLWMVPDLKREFGRALVLDPREATACDALGVLYYELPGFAGGSLARSEDYLTRGIAADPNYPLLRLDLARVYMRQKRWSEARSQLNRLLATDKPTYPGDFVLDDTPEARRLLEQIKDK